MKPRRSVVIGVILVALVAVLSILAWQLPPRVERLFNRVIDKPPYAVSARARTSHDGLFVADLHADTLLWDRDLLERAEYGHLDLPRLRQANVGLQVFSAVTKVPKDLNYEANAADTDSITLLTMAQLWPPPTWGSLLERALYQAHKLRRFVDRSQGGLMLVTDAPSLERMLSRHDSPDQTVGALLALEGAHALEGKLENLDRLYDAGYRMIGLVHLFDNRVGGSGQGTDKAGLTAFGRALVQRIEAKPMILDLAHSSDRLIDDVLTIVTGPLISSHTGVRGTCDHRRNLSDEHLQAISSSGGIIGIGFFEHAVCGTRVEDIVKALRYSADLVGAEYLALGSDFDGAVTTPFDVTGLPRLTEALQAAGFSEVEIVGIMGGNVLRFLRRFFAGSD